MFNISHLMFIDYLDVKAFLQNNFILSCNCEVSDSEDKDHPHIVTNDLWIIQIINWINHLVKALNTEKTIIFPENS